MNHVPTLAPPLDESGKDIMIPLGPGETCGPLCGFTLEDLRAKSVWGDNKAEQVAEGC